MKGRRIKERKKNRNEVLECEIIENATRSVLSVLFFGGLLLVKVDIEFLAWVKKG